MQCNYGVACKKVLKNIAKFIKKGTKNILLSIYKTAYQDAYVFFVTRRDKFFF
jgi:hypothetical protein